MEQRRYARRMVQAISLSLNAVIVAVTEERPRILVVETGDASHAVPSGPLDPEGDKTLELGLRRWIREQAGLDVGYVEQLYTFGDRGRRRSPGEPRPLALAYLALVREEQPSRGAAWSDWYELFPWEDIREGRPPALTTLTTELRDWAAGDEAMSTRLQVTFGIEPAPWDPIRPLERYELLYQADLVAEAYRDRGEIPPPLDSGRELAFDHRRIVATGLSRLRGKLTYRPLVFELMPETFTLTQLQRTVEALVGMRLHKQNFRRLIERGQLVEGTGEHTAATGGRPAELFRFREEVLGERPRPGVGLPRLH